MNMSNNTSMNLRHTLLINSLHSDKSFYMLTLKKGEEPASLLTKEGLGEILKNP